MIRLVLMRARARVWVEQEKRPHASLSSLSRSWLRSPPVSPRTLDRCVAGSGRRRVGASDRRLPWLRSADEIARESEAI